MAEDRYRMHALNTNEEMKMKKINYFGKEYTVDENVKWVATSWHGTVMIFTRKPTITTSGWVGRIIKVLDKRPAKSIDWQKSLRKVEDILVTENKLKVGDKVMVNDDVCGFKKGQVVEVYKLNDDSLHLFKGDNPRFNLCDDEGGAYLCDYNYDIIEDATTPAGHPHADLMLKYAMIAQYDDKPWEHFEGQIGAAWHPMRDTPFYEGHNYRLKPQEPVVQVGQTWIDDNGVEVTVTNSRVGIVTVNLVLGGESVIWTFLIENFLQNFKRKG